jgi:DNA-binding transcriptional regulator YiaG
MVCDKAYANASVHEFLTEFNTDAYYAGRMNPIAYIRQEILKVSQHVLAAIANTSQASVSRWETGELEPDREQLDLIRQAALDRGLPWDDRWFFEKPGRAA